MQIVVRVGFRLRLIQAHAALEGREAQHRVTAGLTQRIGREEIGKRVARVLELPEAIGQSTVASWFGDILPPADVGVGLAAVYGVRPGWLYFGELPMLTAENQPPVTISYGEMTDDPRPKRRAK